MENQAVQPNPPILRVGSIFALALRVFVWARGLLFLMPEYNVMVADPLGLVNTCFTDVVVVHVWLFMTATFAISIWRFSTILARPGMLRALRLSLLRNPRRLALLVFVLAYDVVLIKFIYSTWTVHLASEWQILQLFPASTLLLHSALEQCFLAIAQGNEVYRRDIVCSPNFHLAVNFTMLLHLTTTGAVVGSKIDSEPSLFLSTMLLLMPFELFYRLKAMRDWRDHLTSDARNELFTDEQYLQLTQLVTGVQYRPFQNGAIICLRPSHEGEEYLTTPHTATESEGHDLERTTVVHLQPSRDDELFQKTPLVTGYEEICYEDRAASLSNSFNLMKELR